MASLDVKTKAVGPYVLDRTLGRGQTGRSMNDLQRRRIFECETPLTYRIGETGSALHYREACRRKDHQQGHPPRQHPAKGETTGSVWFC